jgi:hypothetical protein
MNLARGSIDCNIRSLPGSSDGDDAWMTMKVVAGFEAGVSMKVLVQGVGMLKQVPWHTLPAEQGHGSHAVCHRLHPFVAEEALTVKSLLHHTRALFNDDPYVVKLERLRSKLDRLEHRRPAVVQGRHLIFAGLATTACESVEPGVARHGVAKEVMKQHASLYKDLPLDQRIACDEAAEEAQHFC